MVRVLTAFRRTQAAIALMIAGFLPGTTVAAVPFTVDFHSNGEINLCDLVFASRLPNRATVDAMLRTALAHCLKKDRRSQILAMAFRNDDALEEDRDYSGPLYFYPKTGKTLTQDQVDNAKRTETEGRDYYTQVITRDRPCCIDAPKHYDDVTLVFEKAPNEKVASDAAWTEAKRLMRADTDVYVSVVVGDKRRQSSWKPLRNNMGVVISANYNARTGKLHRGPF